MQINTMYQAMVEMTQLANAAGASQGTSSEESSFDSMLQEQAQGAQQKPAEKAPAKDSGTAKKPQDAPEGGETDPTAEGYAVAASLVTSQPVIVLETPQPQAEAVAAAPVETVADVNVPVQETAAPVVQNEQPTEVLPQDVPEERVELGFSEEMELVPQVEEQLEMDAQPQQQDVSHVEVRKTAVAQDQTEDVVVEDVEVEAEPVFRQETAVPVKVAENYEPVEPEAEDGLPQLAQRVVQMVEQGDSHVEIALNPANLGTMTVEITRLEDGTLHVVLGAATEKATALLQQHSTGLQHLLAMNNHAEVHIQVQEPAASEQQGQQQSLNPDGQNQQPQQQQQQPQRQNASEDFVQQLRLGLVGQDGDEE